MASRPTMTLSITDGVTITIGVPWYGYTSVVNLPTTVVKMSNGTYKTYDPTNTYDVRQCRCTLYLDATDHTNFSAFMLLGGYRANDDIILTLPTGSGFFPFGPDKGDSGIFRVAISKPDYQGIVESPYKYFATEITMTNAGAYPSYSLPSHAARSEGSWSIGTISGLRFPQGLFKPERHTAMDVQPTRGGKAMIIDRTSYGDWKETEFSLSLNGPKAAAVLYYLVTTARGAGFNIVTPDDYYPYGYDSVYGNGTITSIMVNNILEITHDKYDQFTVDLRLAYNQ